MKPPIARDKIIRITQHFSATHMGVDYSCIVGTPMAESTPLAAADGVAYRGSQPEGTHLHLLRERIE